MNIEQISAALGNESTTGAFHALSTNRYLGYGILHSHTVLVLSPIVQSFRTLFRFSEIGWLHVQLILVLRLTTQARKFTPIGVRRSDEALHPACNKLFRSDR